jgi:protein gp37
MSTNIEWTDITDNIFRVRGGGWWCRKISPGCANCYAEKLNQNTFFGGNKMGYLGTAPPMELRTDIVDAWRRMTRPKKHFVCSMTDVFGEWVTESQAIYFLRGMWRAPRQTFQVLTKRPTTARKLIQQWMDFDGLPAVPSNIQIGTSVENQEMADKRIPELLKIPAKVRFLSVEPMLSAINFSGNSALRTPCPAQPSRSGTHSAIGWAIFGGESGPDARPCNVEWIRSGVKQCQEFGIPVFVKQLGSRAVADIQDARGGYLGFKGLDLKDKKGGDMAEWPEDLRVRSFPGR